MMLLSDFEKMGTRPWYCSKSNMHLQVIVIGLFACALLYASQVDLHELVYEHWLVLCLQVNKNKQALAFYSIPEFDEWKKQTENYKTWHIKYYKGLWLNIIFNWVKEKVTQKYLFCYCVVSFQLFASIYPLKFVFQVWAQAQAKKQKSTLLRWRGIASCSDTAVLKMMLPSL